MNTRRQLFVAFSGMIGALFAAPAVAKAVAGGWSRNLPDGSIGIWFEGPGVLDAKKEVVEDFLFSQSSGRNLFTIADQKVFAVYNTNGSPEARLWSCLYESKDRSRFEYGETGWLPKVIGRQIGGVWMFRKEAN